MIPYRYTLGGFYLARYSDSPVGAFDEVSTPEFAWQHSWQVSGPCIASKGQQSVRRLRQASVVEVQHVQRMSVTAHPHGKFPEHWHTQAKCIVRTLQGMHQRSCKSAANVECVPADIKSQ